MPRTKYSRKTKAASESLNEHDMKLKTFDRRAQQCITKLQRDAQTEVKSFEAFVDVTISRLPLEVRQIIVGELLSLQNNDLQQNVVSTSAKILQIPQSAVKSTVRKTVARTNKRATATSDDGYATEGGCSSSSTSRITSTKSYVAGQLPATMRKTRSSSRINGNRLTEILEKGNLMKSAAKSKNHLNVSSLKTDTFKTPAVPKHMNMYNVITPKIKPNTPLNVLRRPRQGEMVLSMQGSPLLVSTVVEEKTANINVPLSNGNMMSLLPQEGLRISHIPPLDPETMHQLETLKNHIEKVISFK